MPFYSQVTSNEGSSFGVFVEVYGAFVHFVILAMFIGVYNRAVYEFVSEYLLDQLG